MQLGQKQSKNRHFLQTHKQGLTSVTKNSRILHDHVKFNEQTKCVSTKTI
jgi:hypothetical protein